MADQSKQQVEMKEFEKKVNTIRKELTSIANYISEQGLKIKQA